MNLEPAYIDENMEGIPKEVLESARMVGEEGRAFRKMLETYVPQVGYSAPEHTRILNLGCGICNEAIVLSSYFGGRPEGYDSEDVLVVGVDINAGNIRSAERLYKKADSSEK